MGGFSESKGIKHGKLRFEDVFTQVINNISLLKNTILTKKVEQQKKKEKKKKKKKKKKRRKKRSKKISHFIPHTRISSSTFFNGALHSTHLVIYQFFIY